MPKPNEQQVDSIINLMREAGEFLRKLASVADMAGDSLEETQRVHKAVKQHRVPGDVAALIEYVRAQDPELADHLKQAEITRFDMGRLWMRVADNVSRMMLDFGKDRLQRYLSEMYGAKFMVRINEPENHESRY